MLPLALLSLSVLALTSSLVGCSGSTESEMEEPTEETVETALGSGPATPPEPQVAVHRFFDGTRHVHLLDRFLGEARGLTLQSDDVRLMQDRGPRVCGGLRVRHARRGRPLPLERRGLRGHTTRGGNYGWAFAEAVPGTTPLYRCYHPQRRDHLATKKPTEDCGPGTGFIRERILGYVPDAHPFPFLDDQRYVHRLYNGQNHLFSFNEHEGVSAGYRYERMAFRVLRDRAIGATTEVLRCKQRGTGAPFVSVRSDCEGHDVVHSLGWIFPTERPQTDAVSRCVHPNGRDHLVTISPNECSAASYKVEGVIGFAPRE